MIIRLLDAGGNPGAVAVGKDGGNRTPLMSLTRSAKINPEHIEKFLGDHENIDVNAVDVNGNTALFYAVDRGDVSVIATLIAHGADSSHRNKKGLSVSEA